MQKEFLLYPEALALKELGFDEPCFGCYFHNNKGTVELNEILFNHNDRKSRISAPLYQQAFDWFERKHSMYIARGVDTTVNEILGISYYIESWRFNSVEVEFNENPYDCFDTMKSRIACVRKLIELVKKINHYKDKAKKI